MGPLFLIQCTIFEPLFPVDGSGQFSTGRGGMSLAIVKHLVAASPTGSTGARGGSPTDARRGRRRGATTPPPAVARHGRVPHLWCPRLPKGTTTFASGPSYGFISR